MSKAEIIGLVAELYEAKKEAKEYLDYWMNPDEDAKLEEYMKIVRYEFYPPGNREPKTRFSVCKKAISDYKKLKPSAGAVEAGLFDVYRSRLEHCVETVHNCGWGLYDDMGDMFYEMVEKYS